MKLVFLIVLFVHTSLLGLGQKKTPALAEGVAPSTVERVERALASDAMQGRGVPAGAAKAAQFLVAEFERIGLQPLPGLSSFEQKFTVFETRTTALFVQLNNTTVPKDKTLLISGEPHLNWADDDQSARVMVIGAEANLMKVLRPLLQPTENVVVFIDPAHAAAFKQVAEYVKHSNLRAEKPGPYSVVMALAAVGNGAVKYRVAANTTVRPVELRNVVGILPGHEPARAAEQVIFSAHYDHLGLITKVAGDSIANGADDDASGTTAVVTLAEHFKKRDDNARPLIFVAFTAEEIGGLGSRYFASQLNPQQVVAMFNIEMIGKLAKFGPNTAFITGFDKSDFGTILQRNLQGSGFRFEPDPYPEQNLFYRSDNATLARLGVPAHSISTDQIPTDKLYHSVDDEVETLNLVNMTGVISAIAQSAKSIISGQDTPTRLVVEPGQAAR
ncbi:M20/M25/M40 family metallo-hydrolase [Hymenobacter sp. J193]|uniref:M20/M25/M40 family metallo-hydrolase n=1 Tax=Hymenobacter sp. J193 TaxID=2898429 RepID=UPI002150A6BA|nr:M20/M25/M40 family metallo-hydrolase [Hymenobacter sp. J193]MCR5889583.1 M20/M25/M40 family metallo-hydrolase [Hymenobacter sp. J193]